MRLRLLLVFVLSLLLFLLVNMPVRQLFRAVELPPDILVEGLEGTLLAGRIQRLGYRGVTLERLSYRLQPLCLLRLSLCYRLTDGDDDLLLNIAVSPWSGLELGDSRARLPLSQIHPLVPGLLVKPTGELDLEISHATFDGRRLSALEGTAYWRRAGIEGEDLVLGDFRADAERNEQGLQIRLADMPGALLGVEGELTLGERDYRVDLQLEARAGLGESLRSSLELLAQKNGLNRYRIRRQGGLPRTLPFLSAADE